MAKLLWLCVAVALVASSAAQTTNVAVDTPVGPVRVAADKATGQAAVVAPGTDVVVTKGPGGPPTKTGAKGAVQTDVKVLAPGVAVNVDAKAGPKATPAKGPGPDTRGKPVGAVVTVAAPGADAVVTSSAAGTKVAVDAPLTTVTTTTAAGPAPGAKTVVSAPGTAAVATTTAAGTKVDVQAPGAIVAVRAPPAQAKGTVGTKGAKGDTKVAVVTPGAGVAVNNGNVAVGGFWGSVTRDAGRTTVNVPGFSGSFPGGRRMLRQLA